MLVVRLKLTRTTRILLSAAAVLVALAVVAPVAFYQYGAREGWRRQYLRWEPYQLAPAFANATFAEVNRIAATRRWTPEHVDALEAILALDPAAYSDEPYPNSGSDRLWLRETLVDAMMVMSDRLLYGPPVEDELRERIERILLANLDHDDFRVRANAVGCVVRGGLAVQPEVHAQLLVMQHSDTNEHVRNVVRIQLEHDAVRQDLERKGKIRRGQRR